MYLCRLCAEPIDRPAGAVGRPPGYHDTCRRTRRAASARSTRARAASRLIPWDPSWSSYPVEARSADLRAILDEGRPYDRSGASTTPPLRGSPILLASTPEAAEDAASAVDLWAEVRHAHGLGLRPFEEQSVTASTSWRLAEPDDRARTSGAGADGAGLRATRRAPSAVEVLDAKDGWHVEKRLPESERRPHLHLSPTPEQRAESLRLLADKARRDGVLGEA